MRIMELLQPKKTLLADQRVAAGIVTDVLLELKALTKPGVSLDMLDELAERMIRERGATPYSKGYKPEWAPTPYPATICCSVDYEICHAPPRGRTLQEGSIVKYDLGVKYKTGCGDAAITVAVGQVDNRKNRAMRYGLALSWRGITVVRAGVPIFCYRQSNSNFAESRGYTVIREFGGHHVSAKRCTRHLLFLIISYPEDDTVLLKKGHHVSSR